MLSFRNRWLLVQTRSEKGTNDSKTYMQSGFGVQIVRTFSLDLVMKTLLTSTQCFPMYFQGQ